MGPSEEEVLGALSGVRDPELDEPITDLKFIDELRIGEGEVDVRLRLPTPFCAPNFAYLMASDAREALLSVPGVERANVSLDDHQASEEINAGMAGGGDFDETFRSFERTEGEESLEELREIFRRKAFVSRQERLCRSLLSEGYTSEGLASMTIGEVPDSEAREKYIDRRGELGLDISPQSALVVDPEGREIPQEAVVAHLRSARMTRISVEGNAGFCRAVLASRYGISDTEEEG